MDVEDRGNFVRAWAVEPQRFAWLLGAGASALAGLPTATQIRDDLLLRLYAERHALVRETLHPNDPAVASALVNYFDGANGMVRFGSDEDYSRAFELTLPDPSARHQYLQNMLSDKRPSYGQRIFGAFIRAGLIEIAATTNFDALIEQAAAASSAIVSEGDNPRLLNVASLHSSDRARQVLNTSARPILIKLHGDFQESSLKNLSSELQRQDNVLRQAIHDVSRAVGLVVVGYSGRDQSVMEMLSSASNLDSAWPAGLWWFTRSAQRTSPSVFALLDEARRRGVDTHLVQLETFDELMGDLSRQASLPPPARRFISELSPAARVTPAAPPQQVSRQYPIIRYNALPILSAPTSALHAIMTGVDYGQFRARCKEEGWRGVAVMAGGAVWGWGDQPAFDRIVRSASEVVDIDLMAADLDSGRQALLADGLTKAVAKAVRGRPLVSRRSHEVVLAEWEDLTPDNAALLARFKGIYGGSVAGHFNLSFGRSREGKPRRWAEGVRLHVEFRWGRPWLIFYPYTWVERRDPAEDASGTPDRTKEWRRDRWARRKKNEMWANYIECWTEALAPNRRDAVLALPRSASSNTFGGFTIGSTSAYSWRAS